MKEDLYVNLGSSINLLKKAILDSLYLNCNDRNLSKNINDIILSNIPSFLQTTFANEYARVSSNRLIRGDLLVLDTIFKQFNKNKNSLTNIFSDTKSIFNQEVLERIIERLKGYCEELQTNIIALHGNIFMDFGVFDYIGADNLVLDIPPLILDNILCAFHSKVEGDSYWLNDISITLDINLQQGREPYEIKVMESIIVGYKE